MNLVRTKIESYELMNEKSLINIKSDQTSTVTISQTTFTSIAQIGTGNGAAINAQLQQDSILKVTDSCTFYNCSTLQNDDNRGGAINAVVDGSNSQFIVSDLVKFEKCQSYQGGAISVELLNMGTCEVNNVQFQECTVNNDGGGIFAQLQNSGGILTITNHTSFVQCINTIWGGGGILIFSNGLNSRCIISDKVIFEKCYAERGGAIYIEQYEGGSFDVHNAKFKECNAYNNGGAIYIEQYFGGSFDVHKAIIKECEAQNQGGAIFIRQYFGGSFDVHNAIIKECEAQSGGAIYTQTWYYWGNMGSSTATISGSTFSGSKSVNEGGAIYTELYEDVALTIDNTQFNLCYSTDSDGGSIFAFINEGSLSLNQVIFTDCNCTQPGYGGAIAIVQQDYKSRISITDSSFTNCLTLPGSSSQRYGWGGAIYIQIRYQASLLTETNFLLTNLSFTNCAAFENIGNNLHILSPDIHATGEAIQSYNLLTVKDLSDPPNIISDLYISPSYAYDYMGINQSKVGDGFAQFTDHEPLFEQFFISNVPNPSYIDASNGKDIKFCGGKSSKCKTIKYSTERNPTPLSGIKPTDSSYSIILTSNTELDTDIQIMSITLVNGHQFSIRNFWNWSS
ncbi:MAG: hypothetical protein EZS28_036372 [Streblomastix strix]|uniref:Right handed beta helix domain-containing protein n=1 Tax=Streblomastix strix TaxID=222440 RepID=A0A5J4UDT3_9EUKA|nr:MAG: hypothetical protein EZS28_036372 [Streblomastix strix]